MSPNTQVRPTLATTARTVAVSVLCLGIAACNNNVKAFLAYPFGWQDIPETDRLVGEQSEVPAAYRDVMDRANIALESALLSRTLPALAVSVGKDGDVLWSRSIGMEDLSTGTPVTLSTKFRIGSTAKALTGTTAAKLVEEGVLDLDSPIETLVPYFPSAEVITPRHLLTHTAGIRHYEGDEYYNQDRFQSVESAVGVFAASPLMFGPGSAFAYSTYGYVLASAAMEGATGTSFDDVVRDHLTSPLGMTNTMSEVAADGAFALPHEIRGDEFKAAFPIDSSNRTAGGGFVSTPTDLVAMTQAILGERFLDPHLVTDLLLSPQRLETGEVNEQNYALGWRAHRSERFSINGDDQLVAHHYGKALGGESFLVMYPEHRLSISVVTNRNLEDIGILMDLAHGIAEDIILTDRARSQALASPLGDTRPGRVPVVLAPGLVNTPENREVEGVFGPDMRTFYFVRRPWGEASDENELVELKYQEGGWQTSVVTRGVSEPSVSPDGRLIYLKNEFVERAESGWSDVTSLGPPFDDIDIMRLSAASSGTVYFDTFTPELDRPLRYSRRVGDEYEEPTSLGPQFGVGVYNAHPFIAPDESYVIWDSRREGGYGSSDLYISYREADGTWGPAINLGEDINTAQDENYPSVSPDGSLLIFDRRGEPRPDGERSVSIFWVGAQIIEELRPGR